MKKKIMGNLKIKKVSVGFDGYLFVDMLFVSQKGYSFHNRFVGYKGRAIIMSKFSFILERQGVFSFEFVRGMFDYLIEIFVGLSFIVFLFLFNI